MKNSRSQALVQIEKIKNRVLAGEDLTYDEAIFLMNIKDEEELLEGLFNASREVKEKYNKHEVSLCSIISGKVGSCSEDCKFCAQSAHYSTEVETKPLPTYEQIKRAAEETESSGVKRFSIVSSGKGLDGKDLEDVIAYYNRLSEDTDLHLCASLGILSEEALEKLSRSGVQMYHHNLESGRDYYEKICSTHSYDERIETIKLAKKLGMKVCCGGIIGMGESAKDRADFMFQLKELKVDAVPLNILDPIKGTPLENLGRMSKTEILKTIAVFRLALPEAELRYAGGRKHLDDKQKLGIEMAINGMLVGNFLTTVGNSIEEDMAMISDYTIV